ncbi:MAG TPA: hypothetical protein VH251_00875, partial [Verrucomicrobiae bacterium]|nr:hypothetical protein [Verrucomicrobiae bacterium]
MRTTAVWICCCACLNCIGWLLSAIHQLNAAGYAVATLAGLGALWAWRRHTSAVLLPRIHWQPVRRRFGKFLPLMFLTVGLLEFLGGAIYAPNNYDGLTYRLPRMLNWLVAGHWFWIQSINERMNYSTAAWEWIAMPLLAILRSDRSLFLIDIASFFLMPGLIFSVFRRLGVARKAAWNWMWIFPLAFGYATQAGSIGNDLTGTVFALASVCFGLRARSPGKVQDIWLAGLAAALMTGVKLSNAPLVLPCLVAVWPALPQLRKQWITSVAVAAVAVLASAAPIMVLNQVETGSWTGDPANASQIQIRSHGAALLGNSLLLAQQCFMPPVLPGARKIDDSLNKSLPAGWQKTLQIKFPRYHLNHLNELPQEETAGLGLGVTILLLAGVAGMVCRAGKNISTKNHSLATALVGYAACGAALFYMLKMGSEATARLMLPYYPLAVVPILMSPAQGWLSASRVWKWFAAVAALGVLPAVILSPSRPLFPLPVVERFLEHHPENA